MVKNIDWEPADERKPPKKGESKREPKDPLQEEREALDELRPKDRWHK